MLMRKTELVNLTVQFQSQHNPVPGLPVQMVFIETIVNEAGEQIGDAYQIQRHLIPSDMTLELVEQINNQLATTGHMLLPIETE